MHGSKVVLRYLSSYCSGKSLAFSADGSKLAFGTFASIQRERTETMIAGEKSPCEVAEHYSVTIHELCSNPPSYPTPELIWAVYLTVITPDGVKYIREDAACGPPNDAPEV